jgi:hypothetical protein
MNGCGIEVEILFCDEGTKKIATNSPNKCSTLFFSPQPPEKKSPLYLPRRGKKWRRLSSRLARRWLLNE